MTMEDLIKAGAPKLPSGYFYRIYPGYLGRFTKVSIRKDQRFGSAFVNEVSVRDDENVPHACQRLWEIEKAMMDYFSKVRKDQEWLGDHR